MRHTFDYLSISRKKPNSAYLLGLVYLVLSHINLANAQISVTSETVNHTLNLNDNKAVIVGTLVQPHLISVDLSNHPQVVLKVQQPSADVHVRLFNNAYSLDNVITEWSIPADFWLPETLYLSNKQCTQCILEIRAFEEVDQHGNFSISQESTTYTQVQLDIARLHSLAAELWYKASKDHKTQREYLIKTRQLYNEANAIAKRLEDTSLLAYGVIHASWISYLLTDFETQKALIQPLLQQEDLAPKMHSRALSMLTVLDLFWKTNSDNVAKRYEKVLSISQSQQDPVMEVHAQYRLGQLEEVLGHFGRAKERLEDATTKFIALSDMRRGITGLIYLGWLEYRKGDPIKAMGYLQQAKAYAPKGVNTFNIDINIKLAKIYRNLGNFERAHEHIDEALKYSHLYPSQMLDGWAKQEKARILMVSGQFDLAIDYLFAAKTAHQSMGAKIDENNIDYFLGDIYLSQGKHALAKTYIEKVLLFDKDTGSQYEVGTGYNKLAEISFAMGDYGVASRLQQQALSALSAVDDASAMGTALGQSAAIDAMLGNFLKAKTHFQEASNKLVKAGNSNAKLNINYKYALALVKQNKHAEATTIINDSISQFNAMMSSISQPDRKRSFVALAQKFIALNSHVLTHQSLPQAATKALVQSEIFRALTLAEKIALPSQKSETNSQTTDKRNALMAQLYKQALSLKQTSEHAKREAIATAVRDITSQLYAVESAYKQTHSSNIAIDVSQFTQDDLQQLQSGLSQEDAVMYFDLGELSSHLWVIKQNNIHHITLPSSSEISTATTELYASLTSRKQHSVNTNNDLSTLSTMLFNSVDEAWLSKTKKLIVVPNGALNLLPFSVLQLPHTKQALIERFSIAYTPSLQIMSSKPTKPIRNKKSAKILLVANPKMRNKVDITNVTEGASFDLVELPYTQSEVDKITSTDGLTTTLLTRANANKVMFNQTLNTAFDIIHFATHGISNSQLPAISGLVLSNEQHKDNLLMAPEIASMNMAPYLAVLSGCETTYGSLIDGEGFMGISRAFFEAGAQNVVGSLWKVQDDATALLMGHFYEALIVKKLPPIDALKDAKRFVKSYRRKNGSRPWRDPFYWAGFVLQGNGSLLNG